MEQRFYIPEHRFSPCALRRFLYIRVTRKVFPLANQKALMKFHSIQMLQFVRGEIVRDNTSAVETYFAHNSSRDEMFGRIKKFPPLSFEE